MKVYNCCFSEDRKVYKVVVVVVVMEVKCQRCGKKWDTKTEYCSVTCPKCGIKVKVRSVLELKGEVKNNER